MRSRHLKLVAGVFALALAAAGPLPAYATCSDELHLWDGAEKEVVDLVTQDQSLSKQIGPAEAGIVAGNIFNAPASAAVVQQFCVDLSRDVAVLKRAFLVLRLELLKSCLAVANDATCTQAQRDHANSVCVIGITLPILGSGIKQKEEQRAELYSAAKCSPPLSP
jgi:hypothetical protein